MTKKFTWNHLAIIHIHYIRLEKDNLPRKFPKWKLPKTSRSFVLSNLTIHPINFPRTKVLKVSSNFSSIPPPISHTFLETPLPMQSPPPENYNQVEQVFESKQYEHKIIYLRVSRAHLHLEHAENGERRRRRMGLFAGGWRSCSFRFQRRASFRCTS